MARLDADRIAKTALAVLDKRGFAGFSIRAVAQAMRVSPMALYHYVKSKADLAALVLRTASEKLPVTPMTGAWKTDLVAIAFWLWTDARAHPALAELQRAYRVWTPSMLRMAGRWLEIWRESGLDAEHALLAATASSLVIAGLIAQPDSLNDVEPPPEEVLGSDEPNARVLLTARTDPEKTFELALLATIEGLHTRLLAEQSERGGGRRRRRSRR